MYLRVYGVFNYCYYFVQTLSYSNKALLLLLLFFLLLHQLNDEFIPALLFLFSSPLAHCVFSQFNRNFLRSEWMNYSRFTNTFYFCLGMSSVLPLPPFSLVSCLFHPIITPAALCHVWRIEGFNWQLTAWAFRQFVTSKATVPHRSSREIKIKIVGKFSRFNLGRKIKEETYILFWVGTSFISILLLA